MTRALCRHCVLNIRLYFRDPLALTYGYLFPTLFLVAFRTLYRYDRVPLLGQIGELLTITILGGACFGLPTTLVSERERGVWRRYRLMPVPDGALLLAAIASRYVLLVSACVLQLVLAMMIGMPRPSHPLDLALAFTVVAFAFLGCGLVIAMMADTVPAVQALGQCIFLPMLIVGGVAVPLANLPEWALHASAFLPGRYAVAAIQSSAAGPGIRASTFDVAALIVIGAAGCVAGAKLFRWDEHERFADRGDRAWVAAALAAWIAVGSAAELRNRAAVTTAAATAEAPRTTAPLSSTAPTGVPSVHPTDRERTVNEPAIAAPTVRQPPPANTSSRSSAVHPESWEAVTERDILADIRFDGLPPDDGIVTPIARRDEMPDQATADLVARLRDALPGWPPARAGDPVQRVRNVLYVAAMPDLLQMPLERFAPSVVFDDLENSVDRASLIKILYWIAVHPFDGDIEAAAQFPVAGLPPTTADPMDIRARGAVYGVKLLGRLLGQLQP